MTVLVRWVLLTPCLAGEETGSERCDVSQGDREWWCEDSCPRLCTVELLQSIRESERSKTCLLLSTFEFLTKMDPPRRVGPQLPAEWPEAAFVLLTNKCSDCVLQGRGPGKMLTILTSCPLDLLKVLVWTGSLSVTCFWSGWKYHEAASGAGRNLRPRDCCAGLGSGVPVGV